MRRYNQNVNMAVFVILGVGIDDAFIIVRALDDLAAPAGPWPHGLAPGASSIIERVVDGVASSEHLRDLDARPPVTRRGQQSSTGAGCTGYGVQDSPGVSSCDANEEIAERVTARTRTRTLNPFYK